MARYIQTCDSGHENAYEQISIWTLAEYLWATKNYSVDDTIEFIRGLVEQEECLWDENELRKILVKGEIGSEE